MRAKHRNPIVACCLVVFFLAFFIGILLACARRFNNAAIARRAREAEQSAAQAVARAERRRRHGPALPEAEAAPATLKYQCPALGNVIINDADDFKKLRGELVEVEASSLGDAVANKEANSLQQGSAPAAAASASAAPVGLAETFVEDSNEPLSTTRRAILRSTVMANVSRNRANKGLEIEDGATPYGHSLEEGGFVIVVCGNRVGDAPSGSHGNEDSAAFEASTGDAAVAPSASSEALPAARPTMHLYRCLPSNCVYGESKYTTTNEEEAPRGGAAWNQHGDEKWV
ncbi:hypothetical protein ABB37_09111 [Leptomonas pyrrhocoris]|uniref:Uncharacterized protein n=1 Tax=Leptomonas pyrrhocoris TaxID=157538 RepID=A0A0M9FR77_LEPPY|nr:hypothetical protein ABB37_09111 [Leptomonas pyrrhocoris]KPA74410.1 hypothetical protein ABB37_09111 [Leptomonas pyrrhocoris]|eukprot:XP_015652849.1 hypothetical protein ABB37_09111 [Leptomonas pyrrhocoris]